MEHAATVLVIFALTAAVSVALVSRTIVLSRRLGLLDQPGPRRVHQTPLPRAGGLAVFLAFTFGLVLSFSFDVERLGSEPERLLLLLGGSCLIVGLMVYDDAIGIPAWLKLAGQIAVAALVVLPRLRGAGHGIVLDSFNLPFAGQVSLPLLAAIGFTIFWIVGMMNTMNWLDGLDGLAGSVSLVACAVLFAHTYFWPRGDPQFTISILPLVLGAAVLGFLPYNWHPSRIILGDAGANFLGFALAVLSIIGGAKIATALLALGLPVLDVAWVIAYRAAHGRSPLGADRGHLHHRLLDRGWSQARIVLFVAGVSAVFGLLALVLPSRGLKLGAILALGLVLLSTVGGLAIRDRSRG
ncbi:MAG: UDP-GlcNAc:undecaprenyl-phosphate/decaprenyl-phosphate GlcNAc-phosphate transferase [Thermomicrobiales bacterium]|nr:UDP-GlcNAc:undecaprenyl-phosphate/decaprenyl-phosphate GlcNAc-phosphate transferase [Thermomicrobiales bacterium]